MIREAEELAALHKNIVIKIRSRLKFKGYQSFVQKAFDQYHSGFFALLALLAAKAGTTYVSPYVGRLDDIIRSAWIVQQIKTMFDNYGFTTEIIVAYPQSAAFVEQL
jgi:transaldolase